MAISTRDQLIAYVVIHALLLIPVFVLAVFASKNVRKEGDPARKGFTWLIVSLWLFVLYITIAIITWSLWLSGNNDATVGGFGFSGSTYVALRRLEPLGSWFSLLSQAALVVSLADLAGGVKLVTKADSARGFRIFIAVLAALAAVAATAYMIWRQYALSTYRSVSTSLGTGVVGLVVLAALFIAMLATMIFALRQRHSARRHNAALVGAAGRVASAATLAFVIYLVDLIASFVVVLVVSSDEGIIGWGITEAIISRWGMFAIYVIIYLLGRRPSVVEGGLWAGEGRSKVESYEQQQVHGVGSV